MALGFACLHVFKNFLSQKFLVTQIFVGKFWCDGSERQEEREYFYEETISLRRVPIIKHSASLLI